MMLPMYLLVLVTDIASVAMPLSASAYAFLAAQFKHNRKESHRRKDCDKNRNKLFHQLPKSSKKILSGSTPRLSSMLSTAEIIMGGPQR